MKDKKKFGGCSLTSKNHSCKKFGWSYVWDGVGYYERWVEQVYKKLNNVT